MGILQIRTLEWVAYPSPEDLPNPGIKLGSLVMHADSLQAELPGKPHLAWFVCQSNASQEALVVKNLLANAGDVRDTGSIPGSGRSLGEGHGNPLRCSSPENPVDRGAWQTTVHRITKSQKQ